MTLDARVGNVGEQQPLLTNAPQLPRRHTSRFRGLGETPSAKLLAIPFLAALAIATTAATENYAYAVLVCEDATHCAEGERSRFASTVAAATTIANVAALCMLGLFVRLCKNHRRASLFIWILCRSLGIVGLVLGVAVKSVAVALTGRIFEGFASDNLLHFNLNSIYAQEDSPNTVLSLIGLSLTVYMLGICIGPALSSLLPDFRASFLLALVIFGLSALYLLFIKVKPAGPAETAQSMIDDHQHHSSNSFQLREVYTHVRVIRLYPRVLLPHLSLFFYNLVQSFAFQSIMTFNTLEFAFTGRQNGFVISLVHAVAAIWLFLTSFVVPRVRRWLYTRKIAASSEEIHQSTIWTVNGKMALMAMLASLLEAGSLMMFAFIREGWQVYPLVCVTALGLASPAFIKSYTSTLVPQTHAPDVMASLAAFEVVGSLLSPAVVGTILANQSSPLAFLVSSGLLGTCVVLLGVSLLFECTKSKS